MLGGFEVYMYGYHFLRLLLCSNQFLIRRFLINAWRCVFGFREISQRFYFVTSSTQHKRDKHSSFIEARCKFLIFKQIKKLQPTNRTLTTKLDLTLILFDIDGVESEVLERDIETDSRGNV